MQLIQCSNNNNINEYWVVERKEPDVDGVFCFYLRTPDDKWERAWNVCFDRYCHTTIILDKFHSRKHVIEFTVNGKTKQGIVSFVSDKMKYSFTEVSMQWGQIEDEDDIERLEARRAKVMCNES